MEPIPRAAVWVARGHLVLVVLGLVAAGITAIAMRVAPLQPGGGGDVESHARLLALHGAAMTYVVVMPAVFGTLGNLVVPEAMRAKSVPTIPLAALGLVLWACGAIVLASIVATADGWTFYTPASVRTSAWVPPALLAMGMALTLVHFTAVVVANIRTAAPLAIVVVLGVLAALAWQCVGVVQTIIGHLRDPWLPIEHALGVGFETMMHANVIATLAIVTHLTSRAVAPGDAWPRRAAVGLAGVALWYVVTSHWVVGSIGLGAIVTLVALWLFAAVRTRGWRDPLTLSLICGIAPALVVFGVARWVLARPGLDIHLHDTLFVVGTFHMGGAIVGLAWIAGVLVWSPSLLGRTPRVWPARIGTLLVGTGSVAQSIAMLVLGNAGMPRRYATYMPQFTEMQRVMSIAAFAVAIGAMLLVAAFVAGRRDESP